MTNPAEIDLDGLEVEDVRTWLRRFCVNHVGVEAINAAIFKLVRSVEKEAARADALEAENAALKTALAGLDAGFTEADNAATQAEVRVAALEGGLKDAEYGLTCLAEDADIDVEPCFEDMLCGATVCEGGCISDRIRRCRALLSDREPSGGAG